MEDHVWMTPQARAGLESELAALLTVPHPAGPDETDHTERVVDAWLARKERIRQIHELLSRADRAVSPADDGIAEPGMVLTVRFDDTGETETFLLGSRGAADPAMEVYSVRSPLGCALVGAGPGQQRSYPLPGGGSQLVTVLAAKPFGTHLPGTAGSPELAAR